MTIHLYSSFSVEMLLSYKHQTTFNQIGFRCLWSRGKARRRLSIWGMDQQCDNV